MRIKFWQSLSAALAMAVIATPAFAGTIIVDDSFDDDSAAITGTVATDTEIAFFGTSGTNALQDGTGTGTLGLVTGTSGRQIHGVFPTQTLATAGDTITSYVTFTTPDTVLNQGSDDIRIGLFSDGGNDLAQNFSASSSNPEALLNGLAGFAIELDVDPATVTDQDVNIRRSDPSTTGRLLGTNTGISNASSSADNGYVFTPNTTYQLHTTVTLNAAGGLDVLAEFFDPTGLVDSDTYTDATPNGFDFGLLALGASTNAFGSTNSFDTPGDNGIELDNVTIHSTIASAIPEPSSLALLGLIGCAGFVRRRR